MCTCKTAVSIQAYDRNASKFAEKFMDYVPYKEKLELFQRRFLTGGEKILDVGCGPGNNARILLAKDPGCRITGIDLSVEMIDLARENAPAAHFRVEDIRDLQGDETYDAIIASFCIVHLSDTETAALLADLAGRLEKGGCLYLSFMEGKSAGFETTSFSTERIFFNYHDREAICRMLAALAVEALEITAEGYPEQDGSATTDVFLFCRKQG